MALDRPDDDFEAGDARPDQHLPRGGADGSGAEGGGAEGGGAEGSGAAAARAGEVEPRTREEYYEALRAADGGSVDDGHAKGGGSAGDGPADGEPADSVPADSGPADGEPADEPDAADSRTDHSGWDAVDAADRPSVEAIRISPERTTHILDGDGIEGGGGHRHGVGKPGKTEFPATWDDEKIMGNVLDIARRPDSTPVLQHWNDRWVCSGTRDSVEVSIIVLRSGEVWTAWPEEGSPGVKRNPRKETS